MSRAPRKITGVENRERKRRDGSVYWTFRVRWIDPSTGSKLVEEFDEQRDAIDFHATLRLARRRGALHDLNAGRETLAEYAEQWWESYASRNLARSTLAVYASLWNRYALPRLGHLQLRAVTPGVIARFRSDLEAAGVGAPTVRKTMSIVQAMLRRAVEEDRVRSNAAAQVRKPSVTRQRAVAPLAPDAVEALRAVVGLADAALISVLAYAGLRPEEALALEWRHVRRDTLLVEQKNVDGEIVIGQKVAGRSARTVDLLGHLRSDLAAHRLASGRPTDRELVFATSAGAPWPATRYRSWRRWTFQPAAAATGIAVLERTTESYTVGGRRRRRSKSRYEGPRPYDLRHSFASLLIHEGRLSVVEVAAQLGHSTETLLRTYAHVFAELRGQPKIPADEQIRRARADQARRTG